MVVLFVLLEILLLAPPYGSLVPMAAGFALMLVVAVVRLDGTIMVYSRRHLCSASNFPPLASHTCTCVVVLRYNPSLTPMNIIVQQRSSANQRS